MTALGVTFSSRVAPPARGAPTDNGTAFLAGKSASGPSVTPTKCYSLSDFTAVYGERVSGNQVAYDWLDDFFREGGVEAVFSRYVPSTTQLADALASFTDEFGPGQVAAPSETPGTATYQALLTHCYNTGRFALCDVNASDTLAQMETLGDQLVGCTNADWGMLVGPWATVPAPAGVIGGSTRDVNASAYVAALMARADALGNPNRASAGRDFPLQYAVSLKLSLTQADALAGLAHGLNVAITKQGVMQLYGFQTGMAENSDNPFWQANCARARNWLKAQAVGVGENYMFKPIDGRGLLEGRLATDLDAICLSLYNANGLYGETPADAWTTTTGVTVNPDSSIARGELHGVIEARFSPHAKSIPLELVAVPVTGHVSVA